MVYLFWVCAIILIYTFAGYPLLLWLLSVFRSRGVAKATIWPKVSLIITAHNEAGGIAKKVKNCLDLNYPEEKLEVIVASDGSNDRTPDIVRSFASHGVSLVETAERRGKHHAQMVASQRSSGEILVFTDVGVSLERDTLMRMVANFADPSVGCVSSEDRMIGGEKGVTGEPFYVRCEMALRRLEAKVHSLVGLSGSLFAVRRELCDNWHPGQSSDFFLALHAVARGSRAVVDPECFGDLSTARSGKAEFSRKVRTIVHGLDVFFTHLNLLNPVRHGLYSWQLISHKLLRWLAPFALLLLLVSNSLIWRNSAFYRMCLIGQVVVYGCGLFALATGRFVRFWPLRLAGFLVLGSLATIIGWIRFWFGEKYVAWEPTKRS